ncbi:MAG: hypothetical protein CME19_01125 [Gemmatimonadetes bacterium]|nr:hypothetical protein [Gemmatimonadota bacterium]|tara:strand:+ start:55 stop:756 length:702 start_codon:yes stop_codon:yes gene_type:complete
MRESLPDIAELADRELPTLCAGSVAPDAVRYYSDLGKFGTHFYLENRKDTWGRSVSGMFEAHPELSDPGSLGDREVALLIGYISHLTVDEAFRDEITYQVHGIDNWRPLIKGLWSLADEFDIHYSGLVKTLAAYAGDWSVGFIDGAMIRNYLGLVGPWAETADPWEAEQVFHRLVGDTTPADEARAIFEENRQNAASLLDRDRLDRFAERAVASGLEEVRAYVNGGFCKMPCT